MNLRVGAILVFLATCALLIFGPLLTSVGATEPVHEDDPRWNCATMGNRICGPDQLPVTL
jgi:hypothetical protein